MSHYPNKVFIQHTATTTELVVVAVNISTLSYWYTLPPLTMTLKAFLTNNHI